MNYLMENWYVIIGLLILIVVVGCFAYRFFKLPTNKQLEKVKIWLLLAVTEAERQFSSGTGKLKLRYVYDLFIVRFKWISRLITFEMFSLLVDEALEEMREMLATNKAVSQYVEGEAKK